MWTAEDKALASAEYAKFKRAKFGDDDDDDIDHDCHGRSSEEMTMRQRNDARK